ncbi:MAG: DUF4268 domain-containing protein [Pedobacter sp.]|nr:DUF4268 domain-containing protein [Pedobacter sp.]
MNHPQPTTHNPQQQPTTHNSQLATCIMYSKEEASKLRQQFWITFGKYMKPIPSADGLPINWINYKTGVKSIFFKMNAEQRKAMVAIEIAHPDPEMNRLYFERFLTVRSLFLNTVGEDWNWEEQTKNEQGVNVSRISIELVDVSVYDPDNWPQLISFLKPRMMALDEFWTDVKPIFESL